MGRARRWQHQNLPLGCLLVLFPPSSSVAQIERAVKDPVDEKQQHRQEVGGVVQDTPKREEGDGAEQDGDEPLAVPPGWADPGGPPACTRAQVVLRSVDGPFHASVGRRWDSAQVGWAIIGDSGQDLGRRMGAESWP